jgi:hypothetical protein
MPRIALLFRASVPALTALAVAVILAACKGDGSSGY